MTATTTVVVVAPDSSADVATSDAVRIVLAQHGGRPPASERPALTALFSSAVDAVRAAVDVQRRLQRQGELVVTARIGVDIADDVVVASVSAQRLCDLATAGDILVSLAVRAVASSAIDLELVTHEVTGDGHAIDALRVEWAADMSGLGPRVVVADDAALIRAGLVQLLSGAGFDVVAEAADAVELIDAVERERPDLVLTDVRMPPDGTDDGLRAALALRASHPGTAVLVLSQHLAPAVAADLLDHRASGVGYLLKERVSEPGELVAACHHVLAGGRIVDPTVAERLLTRRRRSEPLARLTDREREVLEAMASGRSNTAIAESLNMSVKTVESHVRSIFIKLELTERPDEHRRVTAVVHWLHAAE